MILDPTDVAELFAYDHLPEPLQAVSKPFHDLALDVAALPPGRGQRAVALQKLLEAKDAAVRALARPPALERSPELTGRPRDLGELRERACMAFDSVGLVLRIWKRGRDATTSFLRADVVVVAPDDQELTVGELTLRAGIAGAYTLTCSLGPKNYYHGGEIAACAEAALAESKAVIANQ